MDPGEIQKAETCILTWWQRAGIHVTVSRISRSVIGGATAGDNMFRFVTRGVNATQVNLQWGRLARRPANIRAASSIFQSASNRADDSYLPINKLALVEDSNFDVRVGEVKYVLVVDDYLPPPNAPPATLRLAVCNLYKPQRLDFSPPGIGMWKGRHGINVARDIACNVEEEVVGKVVRFEVPTGLCQAMYDKQQLPAGTLRWASYLKTSGGTD